jgi:dTMP kinase
MRRKSAAGSFIVLEGLDGAGTTTQVERIAAALRREGLHVLTTREPSDGPIGTVIRQVLTGRLTLPKSHARLPGQTLALLFAADRMDHLAAEVTPALNRGEVVLCDRYVLSSLAYQGSTLSMDWVERINQPARAADLTLFLHVDPRVARTRRMGRGGKEELFDAAAKQRRVARQYQAAIRRRSVRERIVRLNGALAAEAVTREALGHIHALVERRRRR